MNWRQKALGLLFATVLGAGGALIFNLYALPLAFMLGAMTVTGFTALSGAPLWFPRSAFKVVGAIVGVFLGASVTLEMLTPDPSWITGLSAQFLFNIAICAIGFLVLRKLGQLDRVTAFFGGAPGGVTEFALLADEAGGDLQTVAFMQSARIFLIVLTIPFALIWIVGGDDYVRQQISLSDVHFSGLAELTLLAALGWVAGHFMRLPAKVFLGPFCLTVIAGHLGMLDTFEPSKLWLQLSQVTLGVAIGCGFVGATWVSAARLLVLAMILAVLVISATFAAANALGPYVPKSFLDIVLALAPAGLMEMSLVATDQNADVPFVMMFHLARILEVSLIVPFLWRYVARRRPLRPPNKKPPAL
ncbi:AbrB family transcriptional regulator [Shimia sediminis]|uniref:AbrB family transcriptional regulator n=1 Tax=Shimia sediminis TaxID=2497945 RepID=UPI0013E02B3A|nr:AbrB family transcriptional regulator [Shimia sediminis]